jgi:MFS family permease
MATIGTLYSWSIFTQPLLVAFHWDVTTTTWAYATANFCVAAVGAVAGGFWQDRVGPRRVALTGITLWGTGNLLAGLGTAAWGAPWLYLTYGVIGGVGAGMAYITPVAMVTKWFPRQRGWAGGLVAGGFGLGAFLYNELVPRLAGFRAATDHAAAAMAGHAVGGLTATDIDAVLRVFVGSGVLYLLIGLPAAALFRNPRPDSTLAANVALSGGLAPREVLRAPQFYLLWLQLFVNVIAGITIISNASFILQDLTHLPMTRIASSFGLVSLFNAIGRLFWGSVSDRIGCRHTFALMFFIQALVLCLLGEVHELSAALAGFAVILLCCGGGFGTMPAYNVECFGTRFMGLNYGMILSAWGAAGLVGPLLMARAKDLSGSFAGLMPLVAAVLCVSTILPFLMTPLAAKGMELTAEPSVD